MSVERDELLKGIKRKIREIRRRLSPNISGGDEFSQYNRYVRGVGYAVCGVLDDIVEVISLDDGERRT